MKIKTFPKTRQYLYYHQTGCSIVKPFGECNCGRDDALSEIDGATTLINDLQEKLGQMFHSICLELHLSKDCDIEDILETIRELKKG